MKQIIQTIKKNSILIDELFKKHINNPTVKELKIKRLKAFLKEITLQNNFDFLPSFDYINTKNSKVNAITFEIFKENILLWLSFQITIYEKQSKKELLEEMIQEYQKKTTNEIEEKK